MSRLEKTNKAGTSHILRAPKTQPTITQPAFAQLKSAPDEKQKQGSRVRAAGRAPKSNIRAKVQHLELTIPFQKNAALVEKFLQHIAKLSRSDAQQT